MEIPRRSEPDDGARIRLRQEPFPHGLRLFRTCTIDIVHMPNCKLFERQHVTVDARIDLSARTSLIAEIIAEKSQHFKIWTTQLLLQDLEARILRRIASSCGGIDDKQYFAAIFAHRYGVDVIYIVGDGRVFV